MRKWTAKTEDIEWDRVNAESKNILWFYFWLWTHWGQSEWIMWPRCRRKEISVHKLRHDCVNTGVYCKSFYAFAVCVGWCAHSPAVSSFGSVYPKLIKVKNEIKSNIVLRRKRHATSATIEERHHSMIRLQISRLPSALASFALHLLMFLLFSRFEHFWSEISGCDLLFKYTELEHAACVRTLLLAFAALHYAWFCTNTMWCIELCAIRILFRVVGSTAFFRFFFLYNFSTRLSRPSSVILFCCCRLLDCSAG